ncbi:MAG: sugar kinase [Planctomycetes bacterium]|nr:sugar kinase [Planctomycetota bacterium]
MSLLVTGSIGIDSVSTPAGAVENVLGGSAVYFAFAAVQFAPVRLVGVVGDDFPPEFRQILESREIDLTGLEVRSGSRTFRWTGSYEGDMNEAETVDVSLNVLAEQAPNVPAAFADSKTVFLANTHPTLQRELLAQVDSPSLVVCDTMNLWIENERDSLIETLRCVHGVIINDAESRALTGTMNLIDAGEQILALGPKFVIIKKGEHGALLVTEEGPIAVPAFPTMEIRDPTGAGDSFAGGLLGYLAADGRHDAHTLRRALVRGTVAASFTIEDFSVGRVRTLTRNELDGRIERFLDMLRFD